METVRNLKTTEEPFFSFGGGARSLRLEAAFYFAVFSATCLLFFLLKPLYSADSPLFYRGSTKVNGLAAQYFVIFALTVVFATGFYLQQRKRLGITSFLFLLLVAGIVIRIGYMLKTPAAARQYDTYTSALNGHEAYARALYEGGLPDNNSYQFYHPPTNAFIQSVFMKITSFVAKLFHPDGVSDGSYYSAFAAGKPSYITEERYFLYQSCQILSVLYSTITCVYLLKILNFFGFKRGGYLLAAATVIFFPRNYQFSAMLNNDALSYCFSVLALYYCLKWRKRGRTFADICLCGLFVGLGMATKLSSATVCLPIAFVFVCEFVFSLKKTADAEPIPRLIAKYAVFLAVCAPIGLWFVVYAKIRFSQPLGYVFPYLNKALSTADVPLFQRLFITFDKNELFGSLFIRNFKNYSTGLNNNYNLFNYSVRSSVFGEFGYWEGEGFAISSLVVAYIASFIIVAASIFLFVTKLKAKGRAYFRPNYDKLFVGVLALSQVVSLAVFYIKMPYSCTMDSRYVMPLILCIACAAAYLKEELDGGAAAKALSATLTFTQIAFLALSTVFYVLCV